MKKVLLAFTSLLMSSMLLGQNKNVSNGLVFDGEPFLVSDPQNPRTLTAAWMGYKFGSGIVIKVSTSTDAGSSWSTPISMPHFNPAFGSADPSMAYDDFGNLFLCYIDFSFALDSGGIYIAKSADNGATFPQIVKALDLHADPGKKLIDRPWIAVGPGASANQVPVYFTTMNAEGATPPYNPYLVRSLDGGLTFQPWKYLDAVGYLAGSLIPQPMPSPAVGADGTFYACYPSYVVSQNIFPQVILAKSSDKGNTLIHNNMFAVTSTLTDTLAKRAGLMIADPSDSSHLAYLYLASPNGDGDVFCAESQDFGATWSSGIRVNDDPIGNNRMQDLVWADFDEDGDLVVSWRDRRNANDSTYTVDTEIWCAFKCKDSSSFEPNIRVADQSVAHDTILEESGNDFQCIAFDQDTMSVVWGDVRTGRVNIWFQRITKSGTVLSARQIAQEDTPVNIYPNPCSDVLYVEKFDGQAWEIYDLQGKLCKQGRFTRNSATSINIGALRKGAYVLKLIDGSVQQKLQFVKQ